MKLIILSVLFLMSCAHQNIYQVETKEVEYKVDGKTYVGYLAKPKTNEKRPGVVVVHEWWGQTNYPRKRAEMLAELGYVAFAADMYGSRKTLEHPKDAKKFMMKAMKDAQTVGGRFQAALNTLKKTDGVDETKTAAIGYCFGGAVVLEAAKQNKDLDAIVSFHGALQTPTKPKKGQIKADILILNGADDSFVSQDAIKGFKQSMSEAKASYEFVNMPNAKHGYTNPEATKNGKKYGLPLEYNKRADKHSWKLMKEFLNENL